MVNISLIGAHFSPLLKCQLRRPEYSPKLNGMHVLWNTCGIREAWKKKIRRQRSCQTNTLARAVISSPQSWVVTHLYQTNKHHCQQQRMVYSTGHQNSMDGLKIFSRLLILLRKLIFYCLTSPSYFPSHKQSFLFFSYKPPAELGSRHQRFFMACVPHDST